MHAFTPITHTFFHYSWFSIFLSFLFSIYCCCCTVHVYGLFILPTVIRFITFTPLTLFGLLWVSFQDCPLVCRLLSHNLYTMLVVPHLIPRQKQFSFVFYSPLVFPSGIRVNLLPYQPLQHASSGSSSYLPLLDQMPSQQDISPNRT